MQKTQVCIGNNSDVLPLTVVKKVQLVLKLYLHLRNKCERHSNTIDDVLKMVQ
jgi:hypothetical protein